MYDFANILFGGPCNRACPFCIGQRLPVEVQRDNLREFPPRGLEALIEAVNRYQIAHVVFTGTVTDPSLYRHQEALLELLRSRVKAQVSLHTNGVLALRQLRIFNLYDKACISFPSFEPQTYAKMMGSLQVPDLAAIVSRASIPVKVSCLINEHNYPEIPSFLERCQQIGVKRLVLRRLYGETRGWVILPGAQAVRFYRGNPVYDLDGMEVTYWSFDLSESTSLNLFPDGRLGPAYRLAENFLPASA